MDIANHGIVMAGHENENSICLAQIWWGPFIEAELFDIRVVAQNICSLAPCLIRDKWGNCDKTEPCHTSHHIPHPVTLSGPVSVTPGGRVSTEFNPKLVAYFTRDNPGHIGHEPQAAAGEIPRIDKMSCEWGWGRCHYGPLPRVCHRR